jgi:hypothetical protein
MTQVSDLYTLYLKSQHLPEQGANATIERVTVEELHPRPGQTQKAVVLWFKGKNRRLILNQGNANRLADLAGDDTDAWPGTVVHLKPGIWGSKPTVILGSVATNGKGGAK